MDQKREDELLTHVAAGTDPLTGFVALPRDKMVTAGQGSRQAICLVLLALGLYLALLLL